MKKRCDSCRKNPAERKGYLPHATAEGAWCLRCLGESAVVWRFPNNSGEEVVVAVHAAADERSWRQLERDARLSGGELARDVNIHTDLEDWVRTQPWTGREGTK